MNKNLFVVATLDEEVIGYTIGEIKTMGKTRAPRKTGHIMNVAVEAKHQGQGIGTILLDEIEKRFEEHGAKIAYLEVRESNKNAQQVYTKRGYQYVKTAENYYGDENGFILTKKLTR
jgi:ribosomal-protein-alanine acetyltransferase